MNYVVSRWVRSLPPPLEPNSSSWESLEAVGGFFFEGGSVLFPVVVLKPWGSTVDAPGLTLTCWVVSPQSWPVALLSMNSQTPHSTDRLSSGKGHPSHFAYSLGVFLFVSGQGMSLFTSSEGFVLWASVGPFPAMPLSCQEVTGSLLSIVKSHRYTFS